MAWRAWVGPDENGNQSQIQAVKSASNVQVTVSGAITTTATSVDLPVGQYSELAIDWNITAITGTSPTYQLVVNRKGADGVYYPIYTGTSQTAAGKTSITLGVGASTNVGFGSTIQIVETVGGTTPSVTRSLSVIGK